MDGAEVPVVGQREPCPCGSGRRYKACHGRPAADSGPPVLRAFAGLPGECDWVALREVVPAATAPLHLRPDVSGSADGERRVTLSTLLPMGLPALVRADGEVLLGLQAPSGTGDPSRNLGAALTAALAAEPGAPVAAPPTPPDGPRLQDLLADAPLEVTVHDGFDYWVPHPDAATGDVAASLERANAAVVPTQRLSSVEAAYWCRMPERSHLRWVLPYEEERSLDLLARVAAATGLGLGEGTRYVGSFRAWGLVVPVWDLPRDAGAEAVEEPAAALGRKLAEAAGQEPRPLTDAQRRARSGLVSRQLTLR